MYWFRNSVRRPAHMQQQCLAPVGMCREGLQRAEGALLPHRSSEWTQTVLKLYSRTADLETWGSRLASRCMSVSGCRWWDPSEGTPCSKGLSHEIALLGTKLLPTQGPPSPLRGLPACNLLSSSSVAVQCCSGLPFREQQQGDSVLDVNYCWRVEAAQAVDAALGGRGHHQVAVPCRQRRPRLSDGHRGQLQRPLAHHRAQLSNAVAGAGRDRMACCAQAAMRQKCEADGSCPWNDP